MNQDFINSFRDYQRFDNWFLSFNPISKLNIFFALGLAAMIAKQWVFGFVLCLFYCVFAAVIGKAKTFYKTFSLLALLFGVFIIILRQFSVHGETILFSVFGLFNVTQEALIIGLDMASSLLGFSGAIVLFFLTTEMQDLMLSLEKKGVSHTASYVVLASFQTMIDLKKCMDTIFESQKARGIETEGNIRVRIKAFFPVLGPLVLGAISSTEEKSIAMDARAFSAKCKHTFLRELRPIPIYEKIVISMADLLLVAVIVYRLYTLFVK
jgi:energy-coupling factor transporter transmembrane protein EcfT